MATRQSRDVTAEQKEVAEEEIAEQAKRIDFYLTEYTVELLAQKTRKRDFFIPQYQREFTWEDERKSRFIESLLMGLPIPFLFFWEMPDGRLEVVDGTQRLRTIEEFVYGGFRLGELDALPSLSGFSFNDLLPSRQRKLMNRPIRGIVLNERADDQARLDLFERINTSSKVANPAEVRRGALAGPFMDLVISLAKEPSFVGLAPVSKKRSAEREHEELVLRFFAYSDGLQGYKDRPAEFLFDYTKRMNTKFESNGSMDDAYRQRFEQMIHFVDQVFPFGFRKSATGKATPRTRFEAIAVGSHEALKLDPNLISRKPDVAGWLAGEEFGEIVSSDGANAIARLRRRIKFVKDRLLGG